MSELKYWTGNLVDGDDVFYVSEKGRLTRSTVTSVTAKAFCILGTADPFDKLTGINTKGLCALPYDTEHKESYSCQKQRSILPSIIARATDNQVVFLLAGLSVATGQHAHKVDHDALRRQLNAINIDGLSDSEIAYMFAGLGLAEKSEREN